MKNYFCSFSDMAHESHWEYGRKATSIAKLFKCGINVPDGYGFSKKGFEIFCDQNNINIENEKNIEEKILSGSFPDDLLNSIKAIWKLFSLEEDEGLIVRSSAIEEDGEKHSFAGIYESILNIRRFRDLQDAVKKCWLSYYSEKATSYREDNKVEPKGLALVIQRMIPSDKSGILFTMNPISGDSNEIVIEAYPGLNFPVVDGIISADKYITNRQGELLQECISKKKIKYCLGRQSFSIDVKSLEQTKDGNPTLIEYEIFDLVRIGVDIENIFNTPCDIEWTIQGGVIYILQTRPITIGNFDNCSEDVYFDCDIPDETECILLDRYSEPASTCYLSLLQAWEEIVYLSFYDKLEGKNYKEKPLQFYFNRVYWNLKYQKEFFDDLPFDGYGLKNLWKKVKLGNLLINGYKRWYQRLNKYEEYIKDFSKHNLEAMNLVELNSLLKRVIEIFCNYIGKDHFQFLGMAQVSYNLLIKKLVNLPDSKTVIAQAIEANVSKNMTMQSNYELLVLTKEADKYKEIKEIFINEKSEDIYYSLKGSKRKEEFRKKFDDFILRHGHRGTSCDDLYTPHWCEDTSIVLEIIKQFISNTSDSLIHYEGSKMNTENNYRSVIFDYINSLEKNALIRLWERRKIDILVNLTMEYMALRENQRYYFDKSWVVIRKIILAMGRILVKTRVVLSETDMFHLTITEIYGLSSLNSMVMDKEWMKIIETRKQTYERNTKITPPYLIKNSDLISLQKKGLRKSYKAIGISPGKATGPVRIISNIKDLGKVEKGEIAVVSTFHPSWTPILSVVGGLVMNYGNILSHGAVVAREYRIPVVVFNDVATQVFVEGQWIEINGSTGRIRVHNINAEEENKRKEVMT